MKRLPASLLFLATLSAPAVLAQHQHFENFEWRERLTDHFALRAKRTNHDPARRYAEKVWDECVRVMPGLEEDFSKNKFRTPGGASGADTAPYRFTVYLIGSGLDYTAILEQQQQRSGWDANQVQSCRITRNYGDPQNRYRVLCKADPEKSAGGETDLTPVFVHGTAATILEGRGLTGNLPFWMTAGWGYYVEHRIFRLCRVHYIDFKTYYANEKADFKRGATLGPNEDWPGPLKKMCKKDIRETLDTVCKAQILTLTPNQSGYIFALAYFLVGNDENIAKYRKLVERARQGGTITKSVLLDTYGYEDDAALEADWYEFMESRDFK
ncbi:MAG: hypothetical protein VYA46_02625 [Verrucomicrobiota bacterium]|nr:hypothetical protein [Verrucomicrobiota bacterium]